MKKIILPIAVLLILGVGIVAAKKLRSPQNQLQGENGAQIQQQKQGDSNEAVQASIQEMMSHGKKQKCEWSDEQGNKGVMYTNGKKVRTEMTFKMQEQEQSSYMVYDNDTVYVWRSGSDMGQKYREKDFEQYQNEDVDVEMEEDVDVPEEAQMMNTQFQFQCEDWKVDDSKFEVPSNIQFQDMAQFMEQTQEQMQQVQQQMQGMCDKLSGAAKEECLKGMQQMEQMAR